VDEERQRDETFKDPEVLRYVARLQEKLRATDAVGKSNSVADLVKTVHRELLLGKEEEFRIPDTRSAVAQCLITYQNSHRADDLWHFITPDHRKTSIWVQLTSGDNKDMTRVARAIDAYIAENPPPARLHHEWFGLTYINVVWQEKMVSGMLQAFLGSFLVVFLLMTILFRSALWGLLSMVPLTITIVAIYGAVGLVGKAYDMPVAVLSSLSLGLAVDFAIHFLARARRMYADTRSWSRTLDGVFGEPARAIFRNIIVIATGFLPLLFAPLVPYKTVGVLLATILLVSGVATLVLLPALMRVLEKLLFRETVASGFTCNCATCIVTAVAIVAVLAINLHQYGHFGYGGLLLLSLVLVPVFAVACGLLSRREKCRIQDSTGGDLS
jgi:predicted RND superfamily exporter protein